MTLDKFTKKSVEAIQKCESLAYEYGNQEIEEEHLLVALLQQQDGLILKLIEKMEIKRVSFPGDHGCALCWPLRYNLCPDISRWS